MNELFYELLMGILAMASNRKNEKEWEVSYRIIVSCMFYQSDYKVTMYPFLPKAKASELVNQLL